MLLSPEKMKGFGGNDEAVRRDVLKEAQPEQVSSDLGLQPCPE